MGSSSFALISLSAVAFAQTTANNFAANSFSDTNMFNSVVAPNFAATTYGNNYGTPANFAATMYGNNYGTPATTTWPTNGFTGTAGFAATTVNAGNYNP
eukprot:CAMPEP_0175143670 /NCGR_PEP_ID=MMETSP0087-20121206/13599_1 /TAXON_ID=136419 /ORGANISM="Unknown Unknown, Strain D1" /LENGTH=98 /DNA_ID=CAMNT_0016427841 /DNA_START=43 /DNA_END=336 /DNA_ORIENTATION=+